jgi:hypothetical protein
MSQVIDNSGKVTKEGIDAAEKALKDRQKQADTDPMVGVMDSQRKFGLAMDNLVNDNMRLFGEGLTKTMEMATKGVEAFRDFVNGVKQDPTWVEKIIAGIGALTAALPGLITAISLIKAAVDWFKGQAGGGGGVDMPDGKGGKGGPGKPGIGKGLLNAGKNLIKGGGVGLLGVGASMAGDKLKESGYQTAGTTLSVAGTAGQYAGMGAMAGSFIPGVGNVVGGVIGGTIGLGMGIFDAMKADDQRRARDWAYSVLTGANDFDKIPDGIKGAVVELLKNPPPEFMTDPKAQQNIGKLKPKIDSYKPPEMQTGGYQEYASGGVASGPRSGYSATLHGTEAIVPLPDGKSIPVQFDTAALAERIGAALSTAMGSMQGSANSELVEVMQQQLSKHQEMIETLKESLDVNQRMLNHAYS